MVENTEQNWNIGSWVNVGFLKLQIIDARAEKDWMPDIYTLQDTKGRKYEFIPHNGLFKI